MTELVQRFIHSYQVMTMTQGAIGIFIGLFLIALICVAAAGRRK